MEEIAETEVEEADTISNTLNFTILGTKGLSSAIKFAEWSKTMDVVVFVDEQNNLTMRRRNWQRIWSVTETRGFTSLAWKWSLAILMDITPYGILKMAHQRSPR